MCLLLGTGLSPTSSQWEELYGPLSPVGRLALEGEVSTIKEECLNLEAIPIQKLCDLLEFFLFSSVKTKQIYA